MRTAVIMLTYNRKHYTEKTLLNYERQLSSERCFDFYLYDNGSADGTAEFLKSYSGSLKIQTTFGDRNIGIAEATKWLLREKCFDRGYDYIVKVDDDEFLPEDWTAVLEYFPESEAKGGVFIGFRRPEIQDYFEGFQWVSGNPENLTMIPLGHFECYRSISSPGCQISTEYWWRKIVDELTDHGCFYGGWDYTFMESLIRLKKYFMVVFNRQSLHFQNDAEFPEFTQFKKTEFDKFRQELKKNDQQSLEKIHQAVRFLKASVKADPQNPKLLAMLDRAQKLEEKLLKG